MWENTHPTDAAPPVRGSHRQERIAMSVGGLRQLRDENAELRDIIVRGVMSTSDQLTTAKNALTIAESRRRQAEISLNVANSNRRYLDTALLELVRLHDRGDGTPEQKAAAWEKCRTALNINGYWREQGKDTT